MKAAPKLQSIEAARGLAALAVYLFHGNEAAEAIGAPYFKLLSLGIHGVDFFFVLSGFIIFYVHGEDVGRPERAREYALKRLIRLFPLLWLVVGLWLSVLFLAGDPPDPGAAAASFFLYPSLSEPIPPVVWTLRHEALFYCAFGMLILSRSAGLFLFALWTIALVAQIGLSLAGVPLEGLLSFFLSSYQIDFLLGAGVAILHRRRRFEPSGAPLLVGLSAVALLLAAETALGFGRSGTLDYTSPAATAWTVALGCGFALLVHAVLCMEEKLAVPKPLLLLGSASYAIYLVHTPFSALGKELAAALPPILALPLIVTLGVAAGIALHIGFERPISRFLRRKLERGRQAAVAPAGATAVPA